MDSRNFNIPDICEWFIMNLINRISQDHDGILNFTSDHTATFCGSFTLNGSSYDDPQITFHTNTSTNTLSIKINSSPTTTIYKSEFMISYTPVLGGC